MNILIALVYMSLLYVSVLSDKLLFNLKENLRVKINNVQPNGIYASSSSRDDITKIVEAIEKRNTIKSPAYSPLMKGLWKMTYTDFTPAAGIELKKLKKKKKKSKIFEII